MEIDLTYEEKIILEMLIQGSNAKDIQYWLNISYNKYYKTKHKLFKKMHVKRTIQLLPTALKLQLE